MNDLTQASSAQNNTLPRYMQSELTQPLQPVSRKSAPLTPPDGTRQFTPPPAPTAYTPPKNRRGTTGPKLGWLYILVALGVVGLALIFTLSAFLLKRSVEARATDPTAVEVAELPGDPVNSGVGAASSTGVPTVTAAPSATEKSESAGPTAFPAATITPTMTVTPGLNIQPWDGQQRFTMLLMGLDKRPNESGTAFRTDTLILVSIDPATHSIGMLSIPRDLFVSIPPNTIVGNNYGLQRINAAYVIGELVKPGSGPQLAMQTVQYNLGIRINAYAVVEFGTVIGAVDAVGGIDVDVPTALYDPAYPDMNNGYDPLSIPAGHVHMDGKLALKYARTRHQSSDLDRAKRQQQVITAIRDKVLNLNMAPQLVAQAPGLWAQFSSGIKTDLSLEQLIRLALYAKDVPKANVHQGVIDYRYVTGQMWQGMSILVPNRAAIGPLMVEVFGVNYNN